MYSHNPLHGLWEYIHCGNTFVVKIINFVKDKGAQKAWPVKCTPLRIHMHTDIRHGYNHNRKAKTTYKTSITRIQEQSYNNVVTQIIMLIKLE